MDVTHYADEWTYLRCRLPRPVWQRLEAKFGLPAEACKALRLAFVETAERLATTEPSRAAHEHAEPRGNWS